MGTEFFAWQQGMTDWKRAADLQPLQAALSARAEAPAPPPPVVKAPEISKAKGATGEVRSPTRSNEPTPIAVARPSEQAAEPVLASSASFQVQLEEAPKEEAPHATASHAPVSQATAPQPTLSQNTLSQTGLSKTGLSKTGLSNPSLPGRTTPFDSMPAESDGLSAMIEIRPSVKDENTAALDPNELRKVQKEAAKANQTAAAAKARSEGRMTPRTKIIVALFSTVAIGAVGYSAWPRLTEKFGPVSHWLSRLPDTPELTPEQHNLLQAAASSGSSDPSSAPIEMVVAGTRKETPMLYLAADLPDGAPLKIELRANPSQIATFPPPPLRLTVELLRRIAHSDIIRAPDGSYLPRGEYQAIVTDSDGKTRLSRQIWVGADRDEGFNKVLAEYQKGLHGKAQNELQNLKDAATKLTALADGDAKVASEATQAKTASLQAHVLAAWTGDRTKLADEINSLLLPESHYFRTARNAALSLRDVIKSQETLLLSFPGSSVSSAPFPGPSPAVPPPSRVEAAQRITQAQQDLTGKLNDAGHKLDASSGYLEEEK
jgi:hypothetical protein